MWFFLVPAFPARTPILVLDANRSLEAMESIYQDIKEMIRGHTPIPGKGIIYYDHVKKTFSKEEHEIIEPPMDCGF